MRRLLTTIAVLGGCAPAPFGVEPVPNGEVRCISPSGAIGASVCGASDRGGKPTFIPACPDGVAPSSRWHDPADPARYRAARDGSLVGDRDASGPYCLPAPPR